MKLFIIYALLLSVLVLEAGTFDLFRVGSPDTAQLSSYDLAKSVPHVQGTQHFDTIKNIELLEEAGKEIENNIDFKQEINSGVDKGTAVIIINDIESDEEASNGTPSRKNTLSEFLEDHKTKAYNIEECSLGDRLSYTAAVLEFEPYSRWTVFDTGVGILMKNVESIAEFALEAKLQGAEIFVAPEYAVQGLNMYTDDLERMTSLTQTIPDPADAVIPCLQLHVQDNYKAVHRLSCLALELRMYLVIDIAEQVPAAQVNTSSDCSEEDERQDLVFYNAQVVFDRNGRVIARYRKQNLFLEPQFLPGPADDSQAIFVTDFGVTFSLLLCFDITYEHPGNNNVLKENVRDVVMSSAWVDEAPFILAINFHNGWSRSLGVNLMASGYHWPERTKLGSGVYRGYTDFSNIYTYDANSGDVLIVAPVDTCKTAPVTRPSKPTRSEPKITKFPRKLQSDKIDRHHNMLHEDLSVYNRTVLSTTDVGQMKTETLCHNDSFCCTLTYEHSKSDLVYTMLTFSGMLQKGDEIYQVYTQACAVVWCINDDYRTCARMDIQKPQDDVFGPFTMEAEYQAEAIFPILMTRDMTITPSDEYRSLTDEALHTLLVENGTTSLMSAGLFGRWYSRDPP